MKRRPERDEGQRPEPVEGWRRVLKSRRFWAALLALLIAGGLVRGDLADGLGRLISAVLSEIM